MGTSGPMRTTSKSVLASLVLALGLVACSKGGGDVEEFMKMENDKAAAFGVSGDCAAKAKSVGEWRTKNTAKYKELQKKLNEQWPKGPPEDVQKKYGEQMKTAKKAVIDTMMECSNDPAFGKMMDDTKAAE
jgi:hypothetical protein